MLLQDRGILAISLTRSLCLLCLPDTNVGLYKLVSVAIVKGFIYETLLEYYHIMPHLRCQHNVACGALF